MKAALASIPRPHGTSLCAAEARRLAGLLVQGFFLGNVLPMTAVVGDLVETSPTRVCNAYLLDDQAGRGRGWVGLTLATGLLWFGRLIVTLMQREAQALRAAPANDSAESTVR